MAGFGEVDSRVIVIGLLHLGHATLFPINVEGALNFTLQLEHDVLIFSLGTVVFPGAATDTSLGESSVLFSLSGDSGSLGIEIAPLHFGHLIRFP